MSGTDTLTALGLTAGTLAVFAALGIWYSRGRVGSVDDYITARDSAGSGATAATLVASTAGAWILFSPAEAGAAFGGLPAVLGYAVGSAIPLLLFVPLGARIRRLMPAGRTLTEYVLVRYGPWMYGYVLLISLFYMFVFLAAEMTGIAGALALVAGVPAWQTAALVGTFVLLYTLHGGLVASIFTDTVQTLLLLPLLAVGFGAAVLSLGGTGAIHASVATSRPELLAPGYLPGVEFGVYVAFAVLGANVLNQGQWQRVYAARDVATLRRSFALAALAVVPMLFLAGLFGLAAAGLGLVGDEGAASVAFFLVMDEAFPAWVALVVVVLAVLLVASSADTMLNAIASVVTADLPRVLDDPTERTLGLAARVLTLVVAVAAVAIGARGYSVLGLFLTADLLAAATFAPFLHGLYSERPTEGSAMAASVAGLAVGLAYFPTLRGAFAAVPFADRLLPEPSFLLGFVGATVVSGAVAVAGARVAGGRFDLDTLAREVGRFDRPVADGGREEGSR